MFFAFLSPCRFGRIVSRGGAGRKEKEKRLKPSVFALLRRDKLEDRKAEWATFHFLG